MAVLHPFKALRPMPEKAAEVASVPYDVIDTREARELAQGKPLSFLHVIRPEIDLPEGTDEYDDAVYEQGAANIRRLVRSEHFVQEDVPSLYIYRLEMDGHPQVGIFGCVSVDDYDHDIILKHEKTRPDKEDDRTRHILTQQAHAEPVMLTFKGRPEIDSMIRGAQGGMPLYDFTAEDGVRHTMWTLPTPGDLIEAFTRVERLYVADGHHRCKAASRAAEKLRKESGAAHGEFAFFPAVIFPMDLMHIMPYNRIVRDLKRSAEGFIQELQDRFELRNSAEPAPTSPGNICIYLEGKWYGLALPPTNRRTVVDELDVARLNEHIFEPLLGITDPRRDSNLNFVGGIRGTQELERLVDAGDAQMAISMYPTSVEELVDVSDAGLLMPPKSTWFEPKLRSGLLVHLFE